MKLITLMIITAAVMTADETAASLAAKLKTSEQTLRLTQVELNLQKIERMKSEAERLNNENIGLLTAACKAEGLDPDKDCVPDLANHRVTKRAPEPTSPAKK